MSEQEEKIDILKVGLVPKHEVMTEEEKAEFLKKYNVSLRQLPRIKEEDLVIKRIGAKRGSVVKITRNDPELGEYYYYRVVV